MEKKYKDIGGEEVYIDENGNKYSKLCEKCGKYKYYIGWTLYDDSKICHCRDLK